MVRSGMGLVGGWSRQEPTGVKVLIELDALVAGGADNEGFAGELGGIGVGEVLEHGERDEDGVAGGPGGGLVAEDFELDWQVRGLLRRWRR